MVRSGGAAERSDARFNGRGWLGGSAVTTYFLGLANAVDLRGRECSDKYASTEDQNRKTLIVFNQK